MKQVVYLSQQAGPASYSVSNIVKNEASSVPLYVPQPTSRSGTMFL